MRHAPRWLAVLAAGALLLPTAGTNAAGSASFSDTVGHPFAADIAWLAATGSSPISS